MNGKVFVKGRNNFVGVGSDRITLIDCVNCTVEPNTTGLTAINCEDVDFTSASGNNSFYVNGGIVQPQASTSATASAPKQVTGNTYNIHYVDTSGGDVTILFDVRFMKDKIVYFKVIDATNDIVFSTIYGSGTYYFEFNVMAYTYTPTLGDCLAVTFDGTNNFYLLGSSASGTGAATSGYDLLLMGG